MKNPILLLSLFFTVLIMNAQTIENFESIKMNIFSAGTNGTISVVANPDTAGNPSMYVGRMVRGFDGDPWAGWYATLPTAIDLTANPYVHIKVWKPRISPVVFKVEEAAGNSGDVFPMNPQALTGQWEELVFDMSTSPATGEYVKIVLIPDFEDPLTLTEDITLYFDDFYVNDDPTLGSAPVQQMENFETIPLNYMLGGEDDDSYMELIPNPDKTGVNLSPYVCHFFRDMDGVPWGGFWSNLPAEIDVTENKYVHVKVWKPRISPIKFKIEGGAAGNIEIESMYPQTLINEWEDMVFDFSEKTGTYPIIAFLPDFADPVGLTEDIDIYFDDIILNNDPNPINPPSQKISVDMTESGILPGEPVWISGSLGGIHGIWEEPGTNPNNEMTDIDGDGIYSITMTLPEGTVVFKFFLDIGWYNGDPSPGGDRTLTITNTMDVLYKWGLEGIIEPPGSSTIEWTVNMAYQIAEGNFIAGTDYLDLAGTFNGWDGTNHHLEALGNGLYRITVNDFTLGETIEYKFRINGDWATAEFPDGGPNRTYTLAEGLNTVYVWYNDEQLPGTPTDLFFSEYCEGTGNNKGVEIYNPTYQTIDLNEYWVLRYSNGDQLFTTGGATHLQGVIEPFDTFVLVNGQTESTGTSPACDPEMQALADQLDGEYPAPMYMNGNDAIALVKTPNGETPTQYNIIPVDLIGEIGLGSQISAETGWSYIQDSTLYYNNPSGVPISGKVINYIVQKYATNGSDFGPFWMAWTAGHSLIRKPEVVQGIVSNPDPFVVKQQWDTLPAQLDSTGQWTYANIWDNLGTHECVAALRPDFSASDTSLCENETISFALNEIALSADSVRWEMPGGNPATSTAINPEIEYPIFGSYDVNLTTYVGNIPTLVSKQNYIMVLPGPVAPDKPVGENLLCFDEYSSSYTTNTENVIWELEPALAGTMNFYDSTCAIIWNNSFAGEALLKAKSFNICGESEFSEALTIEKMEEIMPDFSATPTQFATPPYDVVFSNLTPNPELYDFVWYFGNGDSSQIINPDYTYPEGGTYTVSLKASEKFSGCTGSIILENYIFCSGTGIGDIEDTGFKYFVDRDKNTLELIFDQQPEGSHFQLCDLYGKKLHTAAISQKNFTMPLNGLSQGMYLFVVEKREGVFTGKIVLVK